MGWFGYGIYDGDGTQTCHLDFCKWAKLYQKDDDLTWQDKHLKIKGTILNPEERQQLLENYLLVIKRMPKIKKYWNEYDAVTWQMLLALFLDNKLKAPKEIFNNGISATEYLSSTGIIQSYCNPQARKRVLNNFIKKALKNQNQQNVKL